VAYAEFFAAPALRPSVSFRAADVFAFVVVGASSGVGIGETVRVGAGVAAGILAIGNVCCAGTGGSAGVDSCCGSGGGGAGELSGLWARTDAETAARKIVGIQTRHFDFMAHTLSHHGEIGPPPRSE
jgi:hypothetical protein